MLIAFLRVFDHTNFTAMYGKKILCDNNLIKCQTQPSEIIVLNSVAATYVFN